MAVYTISMAKKERGLKEIRRFRARFWANPVNPEATKVDAIRRRAQTELIDQIRVEFARKRRPARSTSGGMLGPDMDQPNLITTW